MSAVTELSVPCCTLAKALLFLTISLSCVVAVLVSSAFGAFLNSLALYLISLPVSLTNFGVFAPAKPPNNEAPNCAAVLKPPASSGIV